MNFTSQICTTKEQSERLLSLGLKKETADMGIVKSTNEIYVGCPTDYSFENDLHIPAWSFHRLLELCNVYYLGHRDYDSLIHYLQYLIKEDYFNKEYLEE